MALSVHCSMDGPRPRRAAEFGNPAGGHARVGNPGGQMQAKCVNHDGGESFVLIFDSGDEVMSELATFARQTGADASEFQAIGAFSSAVVGFFDVDLKDYRKIPVDEQVEVLTLVGNISLDKGAPKVHAHVVLGLSDGTTRGGHLLEGFVRPTLELVLHEAPGALRRKFVPEVGLALIRP